MVRRIIKIDEDKCNGCALCVDACHEGAIQMVDSVAKLTRDDYCDGLGDCLPSCPTGAISFETRKALPFDQEAVIANMKAKEEALEEELPCGCPGSESRVLNNKETEKPKVEVELKSRLNQWPVQIKLVPVNAPYFNGAHLLIAADCAAYAYANFHEEFIKGKITLIGCPKLDMVDYSEKLTQILKVNNIKSVTVVRMEVPCCSGLAHATTTALKNCDKMIPWQVVTLSTDGNIVEM